MTENKTATNSNADIFKSTKNITRIFVRGYQQKTPQMWGLLFNKYYFLLYIKNNTARIMLMARFPNRGGPDACPVAP